MKTKVIAVLLTVCMAAGVLAGCGNSEGGSSESEQSSNDAADEDEDDEDEEWDGEIVDITVARMVFAPMDDEQVADVIAAVNEITEAQIGVHVDIQHYDASSYGTQVPMMIQANEKLDLMLYTPVPGAGFTSFKSQNQLMEISGILEEHAPDVVEIVGDLLEATSDSTGTYGVPNYRLLVGSEMIFMRKDILEELDLMDKAEAMESWSDFEEILEVVTTETDLAGIVNVDAEGVVLSALPFDNSSDSFAENSNYDNLGDSYYMVMADEETDTVRSYYESEEFYEMIKRADDWYQKGYVYRDAATAEDYSATLIKNDVGFAMVMAGEIGSDVSQSASAGYELYIKEVTDTMLKTNDCTKFGVAIPVTSDEPEAAARFLNLAYTNEELANMLAWGIEGVDWEVNEDGLADYPEGVTADSVNYHINDFLFANQFIITPWVGSDVDIRQQMTEAMDNAVISKYMGFAVDTDEVEQEVTACFNVIMQYKPGLCAGSTGDVENVYAEFVSKLQAAGIDKVVEAYQAQLDAWLAEQ